MVLLLQRMKMENNSKKIFLYDTTLRDGTQSEDVNFTVIDKLRIAERLIDFGIDCIEGGWPGSNPRDMEFFTALKGSGVDINRISAFGSTRRAKKTCESDEIIQSLLQAEVPNITVFGKTWDLHVTDALKISMEENLDIIYDTIKYLKGKINKVFYDAEHFFDGYIANPEYALKTLNAAKEAGADCLVLCETNGGNMPDKVLEIVTDVKKVIGDYPFGIHAHNDCEMGAANSVMAVKGGASHVQGTINGYGERCGNANLCSIIPNLQLKYGYKCVKPENLKKLKSLSDFVDEMGNLKHNTHRPFVGNSAFAHKGGVHVSAILKNSKTYEHISPELVGNTQRVLLSDLSGKSNLIYKAKEFGLDIESTSNTVQNLLNQLKELENRGFQFEGAEASFELLIRKAMGSLPQYFDILSYRVIDEKNKALSVAPMAEATVRVSVNGESEHTVAGGNGPVNALDKAIRRGLIHFYPELKDMVLVDYKVRILSSHNGTQATTRVLVVSKDKTSSWNTVGVAENIIDASYQALKDSIIYKLMKDRK